MSAASAVHDPDRPVREFYEHQDEASRLTYREGRVELLRTQELLRAALPVPPAQVLDVGGGDGVHAAWLATDGYEVELVDLVPAHVEAARARGLEAQVGDARALGAADDSVDVVLLLGPLYHLREHRDRVATLVEARRVLRPGGLVAVAAVSRIAVALDWLRKGVFGEPGLAAVARRIVSVGYDDTGWGEGVFFFHTPAQLSAEIDAAGFQEISVRGIEGPAWPLIDAAAAADEPIIGQVLEIARLADGDDMAVGASAHLLAFGTA